MTLILRFSGSSGESVLLSFISAPEPSAPQCSSLTPLPMNRTANRLGYVTGFASPKQGSDSSSGSAIVTPTPRSTVRREIVSEDFLVRRAILIAFLRPEFRDSSVQKLFARHNALHHRPKPIVVVGQCGMHLLDGRLIGKHERSPQGIGEQFPAKVIDKIVLPVPADEVFYRLRAGTSLSLGKFGFRVYGAPRK